MPSPVGAASHANATSSPHDNPPAPQPLALAADDSESSTSVSMCANAAAATLNDHAAPLQAQTLVSGAPLTQQLATSAARDDESSIDNALLSSDSVEELMRFFRSEPETVVSGGEFVAMPSNWNYLIDEEWGSLPIMSEVSQSSSNPYANRLLVDDEFLTEDNESSRFWENE